jgi:hypothetical protein
MRGEAAILFGLALSIAPTAAAQTAAVGEADIAGSVANHCVLGAPSPAAVNLGQISSTSGPRAGKLAAIANQTVSLPNSFCNFGGTRVSVSSSAMIASDTSPLQPGFARAVNFTSTVSTWGSSSASAITAAAANGGSPSATGAGGVQPTPNIANLSLVLSAFTAPGDAFLVSGPYEGSVTITLGPE